MEKIFSKLKIATLALVSLCSVVTSMVVVSKPAHAGIFCGDLGGMGLSPKTQTPALNGTPVEDLGNRKYTITDLFPAGAASYSIPTGQNEENWFFYAGNKKIEEAVPGLSQESKDKLQKHGQTAACAFYGWQPNVQNVTKTISVWVTYLIEGLVALYFKTDLLCDPAIGVGPQSNCIDLLGVVGGEQGGNADNGQGGIIGQLSSGVFFPLVGIAFVLVAIYMMYTGFYQRQIRASFAGLLWAFFAFAMGVLVAYNPRTIASGPQRVNAMISQCILESMTGGDCFNPTSGTNSASSQEQDKTCTTAAPARDRGEALQLKISSLTCVINKSFTIDRWAEQQFGYQFNDLYTQNAPNGYKLYSNIEGGAGDYCVNLYSSSSPRDIMAPGAKASFSNNQGGQVCNIAASYMANRTIGDFGNRASMEHIIATATKDDRMWGAMTGDGRDLTGFTSIVSTVAAAISFVPVALYGMAYNLTATILIIFAPVFLLLGIHPGRGRRIFLGWFEALISAFLKYLAIGIMLVVMITMYGAIMSRLPGFSSMIVSIILCFAFMSYRKEMVNLIGATNLGGQKLSNHLGDRMRSGLDKVTDKTKEYAGTAIGAKVAGGSATDALKDKAKKDMSRGRGFGASVVRSAVQTRNKNRKELEAFEKTKRDEANKMALGHAVRNLTHTSNDIDSSKLTPEQAEIVASRKYKEHSIGEIRGAQAKNKIGVIDGQLGNWVQRVNEAKGLADTKSVSNFAIKIVAAATDLNRHFEDNYEDAQLAKTSYINERMAQREEQLMNSEAFLRKLAEENGNDPAQVQLIDKWVNSSYRKSI